MSTNEPVDLSRRRADVLRLFAEAARPAVVRWTDGNTSDGDFEGREASIEVFGIPAAEQPVLYRALRGARRQATEVLGTPVLLLFHTPEATRKHYASLAAPSAMISGTTLLSTLPLRAVDIDLASNFRSRIDEAPLIALNRAA